MSNIDKKAVLDILEVGWRRCAEKFDTRDEALDRWKETGDRTHLEHARRCAANAEGMREVLSLIEANVLYCMGGE